MGTNETVITPAVVNTTTTTEQATEVAHVKPKRQYTRKTKPEVVPASTPTAPTPALQVIVPAAAPAPVVNITPAVAAPKLEKESDVNSILERSKARFGQFARSKLTHSAVAQVAVAAAVGGVVVLSAPAVAVAAGVEAVGLGAAALGWLGGAGSMWGDTRYRVLPEIVSEGQNLMDEMARDFNKKLAKS